MKVVPLKSRNSFKFRALRAWARMSEGFKLVSGVAATSWMPTLLFCITLRNALPFLLTLCCEILGTLMGVLLYAFRAPYRVPSCVPVTRTPRVPAAAKRPPAKKAA